MPARKPPAAPEIEPRAFQNTEEIDSAITKLERRVREISEIDFAAALAKADKIDVPARSVVLRMNLAALSPFGEGLW